MATLIGVVLGIVILTVPIVLRIRSFRLIQATVSEDVARVKKILAGKINIDKLSQDGFSALMVAAAINNAELVKMLLEAGASVNLKNSFGATALISSPKAEISKILLDAGADVHARNNGGWTPILLAASSGDVERCKVLLDKGASLSDKNADGRTPLDLAVLNKSEALIEFLKSR